jgi:hypothetical protein
VCRAREGDVATTNTARAGSIDCGQLRAHTLRVVGGADGGSLAGWLAWSLLSLSGRVVSVSPRLALAQMFGDGVWRERTDVAAWLRRDHEWARR